MQVNESSADPDIQERNYEIAMENFAEQPDFPIEDRAALDVSLKRLGQKPLYRALVDTYGREAAIDGLGTLLPHDLAQLQVNTLVPPELPTASGELGAAQAQGFDAIRQAVEDQKRILQEGIPEDYPMGIEEYNILLGTASQGVLRLLEERGVERAAALAAKLAEDTERSDMASLGGVADEYEAARLTEDDARKRNELEKLSKLARVAGDAAQVVVLVIVGGERIPQLLHEARQTALNHSAYSGAEATNMINGLLDEVRAAGQDGARVNSN